MKKILLGLGLGFAICLLASCNSTNKLGNEVKLLSMDTSYQPQVQSAKLSTTGEVNHQFVVLKNEEDTFDITINLENEKDYHILDFNLTCDDENAMIKVNNSYKKLNTLSSINWNGDTNTQYTIQMQSDNEDFLTTLKMTSLFFIDRETSQNVYNANVDKNNTVEIYRVNEGFNVEQTNAYTFEITQNDTHTDLDNVYVGTTKLEFVDNKATLEYFKDLTLSYEYTLNDIKYHNTQTETYKNLIRGYIGYPKHGIYLTDYYTDFINSEVKVYLDNVYVGTKNITSDFIELESSANIYSGVKVDLVIGEYTFTYEGY